MLGLSNHDLVVLTIQLTTSCGPARKIMWSSYFKANLIVLKKEENVKKLELAWVDHDPTILDPRRKFTFAFDRLRAMYKEVQGELKP